MVSCLGEPETSARHESDLKIIWQVSRKNLLVTHENNSTVQMLSIESTIKMQHVEKGNAAVKTKNTVSFSSPM